MRGICTFPAVPAKNGTASTARNAADNPGSSPGVKLLTNVSSGLDFGLAGLVDASIDYMIDTFRDICSSRIKIAV